MHLRFIFVVIIISCISCKEKRSQDSTHTAHAEIQQIEWESFGEKITATNSLTAVEMQEKYAGLNAEDTLEVKFTATVNSVCKMKGCWMVLDLPSTDKDPQVKFKDYGFFVPKDIEGRQVIVKGKAFIEEVSVEDQKHFAKDAGKTAHEIADINEVQKTYGFLASGVLLKK